MDNPKALLNTHLSGSYFAVLQARRVDPRIKHHSDPSVVRSIRIVRQLEQIFKTYHMMLRKLQGKKEEFSVILFFAKKRKTKRFKNFVFFGGGGGVGKLFGLSRVF